MKSIKILEDYVRLNAEAERKESELTFMVGNVAFRIIADGLREEYSHEKQEMVSTFEPALMIEKHALTYEETIKLINLLTELFIEDKKEVDKP